MSAEPTIDRSKLSIKVDDKLVRFIGIPFFGLVIPSATGLIDLSAGLSLPVVLSYLYYILTAGIIWEGNRFLLFRYYHIIFDTGSDIKKYVLILGLNIFYTLPVSAILLYAWKWVTDASQVQPNVLWITSVIIIVCVIFVTNMYEKALLVKHSENEMLKSAKLEKDKVQAELAALKNQIDPHFMFNALNSVSYLIEKDTQMAQQFVDKLAEVYRYILKSKEKDLVLLADELDFMHAYASLIKLRFRDALILEVDAINKTGSQYLIPPISIMFAIENAVKHNELSEKNRLYLKVEFYNDNLLIINKLNLRNSVKHSTRTGLINLNERFERLIGKEINYGVEGEQFKLVLPLLKLHLA